MKLRNGTPGSQSVSNDAQRAIARRRGDRIIVMGDDVALVQRCLRGDHAGVRAFIEQYQHLIFSVCLRILGHREDAEDVTQEVFIRVLRSLEKWDQERPFRPWLLTIATNRCRTALERRGKLPAQNELAVDLATEHREHSRHEQDELDLGEELQVALAELRPEYRTVFVLFYHQELSYKEIAEMMGCPDGTVKIWLHRARAQLASWLRERGVICEART